jgi:hypothetical protein
MKIFPFICAALLCAVPAVAQPVFSSSSLPGNVGQYVRAYYSTNVNVASMLALTNGAQYWDFSAPQQSYESVQRTDIVGPDDAGDAASFPAATYAERDTLEPTNQIAWRYYTLTNQGRVYYGFDDPVNDPVTPLAVFLQPTLDVPASVQSGQTWNRTVDWLNVADSFIVISNHFATSATVDAYGTLVLPSIGSVPALRVHEIQSYQFYEVGVLLNAYTNQYYYWLVPGLGIAAQVNNISDNSLPSTNSVLRVFESNYFTDTPVTGLQIHIQNNSALLGWNAISNISEYRVESLGSLNNTTWQLLGLPTTNAWSDAVTGTQKFYRVFGLQ